MAAARSSTSPMRLALTASMSPTVATKYQVRGAGRLGLHWDPLLAIRSVSHSCCPSASPCSGSPFKVPVHDVTDATKVKCSGPGLSPGMVRANLPQSFQVDTSKAGVAPLQVKVQGPKGECPHTWEPGVRKTRYSLRGREGEWRPSTREAGAVVQESRVTGGPLGRRTDRTSTLSICCRRERGLGSKMAPRFVSGVTRAWGHSWACANEVQAWGEGWVHG